MEIHRLLTTHSGRVTRQFIRDTPLWRAESTRAAGRFRNALHADLLRKSLEARSSSLRFIRMARLPYEIVPPCAVAWNLVALGEARAPGERTGSSISIEGSLLVNTSQVWAAYREGKTIYTIEPAIADCLARSPWPDRTPTTALRLPSRCPVLAAAVEGGYDLPRGGLRPGDRRRGVRRPGVAHQQVEDDLWTPISIFHLTRAILQECVEAAAAEARVHGGFDEAAELWRNAMAGLVLTMLLYFGGEPDVVRIAHPGERPPVKSKP